MTSTLTSSQTAVVEDLKTSSASSSKYSAKVSSHRLIYADMLRAFAILQVIYVHCVSVFIPSLSQAGAWWACLFPEILGRASVPLFLMLSGMFLLQSEIHSPLEFLKKRMGRVVIPLLVWSLIYLLWHQFQTGETIRGKRIVQLLQNPAYYHLGYLYFLTGLYLAVPILKHFVTSAKTRDYIYFVVLWLSSTTLVPAFFKFSGISCSIQIVVATHLTGYFVTGYALRNAVITESKKRLVWLCLICSCIVSGLCTYLMTAANKGNFDAFWIESGSPTIFIYSACTFLLFKAIDWASLSERNPTLIKAGKSIGDLSFSMYLLHPIVIDIFTKVGLAAIIPETSFAYTSLKMFIFSTVAISTTWFAVKLLKLCRMPSWLIP